jgi:hypothetical protein
VVAEQAGRGAGGALARTGAGGVGGSGAGGRTGTRRGGRTKRRCVLQASPEVLAALVAVARASPG